MASNKQTQLKRPAATRTAELQIEKADITRLRPSARNARLHSETQLQQIIGSIENFGFINPVIIDSRNRIVAGHGRFEAAKRLGYQSVPVVRVEHLTKEQLRAYALADNKIALNSSWDPDILAMEIDQLSKLDLGFDLEVTGFSTSEIDIIIDDNSGNEDDPLDRVPEPGARPVSQRGDLWQLGDHFLICGDALDPASYRTLLREQKAQIVFTDPPYNVKIRGHAGGLGKIKHREFAMASGEMSDSEFRSFLGKFMRLTAEHSTDGAIHFICIDWRHVSDVIGSGKTIFEFKNICVWNKDTGAMGSLYRSKHEMICVFKQGAGPHVNNIKLGANGRYRTNVWDYPSVNSSKRGRQHLKMHPTVKPCALVIDAIKDCSHRGDLVLDPFGGSGTTIIAAEKSGRKARVIELDPLYVDVAIRRWERLTKQSAVHVPSERTFNQIAKAKTTVSKKERSR